MSTPAYFSDNDLPHVSMTYFNVSNMLAGCLRIHWQTIAWSAIGAGRVLIRVVISEQLLIVNLCCQVSIQMKCQNTSPAIILELLYSHLSDPWYSFDSLVSSLILLFKTEQYGVAPSYLMCYLCWAKSGIHIGSIDDQPKFHIISVFRSFFNFRKHMEE